jgi:hypothetical protein
MSTSLTNIRVSVQWTEQTVFAGEDVECRITFRNVATSPAPSRTTLHPTPANGFAPGERQRKSPTPQVKNNIRSNSKPPPSNRGHRAALSLSGPVGVGRPQKGSGSWAVGQGNTTTTEGSTHKRSVSIISIGASDSAIGDVSSQNSKIEGSRRAPRGHGRSASLQIVPRRYGLNGGPTSGKPMSPFSLH